MKKILTILSILSVSSLSAQITPPPSYLEIQDSTFINLSKQNIAVLYDRVYSWAQVDSLIPAVDTISYTYGLQAWHELYLATYNRTNFLTTEEVRNKVDKNLRDNNVISVGYIDYNFHTIAPYAVDSGYITINPQDSTLQNGANVHLAFLPHHVSIPIVPLDDIDTGVQLFYFDPSMKLDNVNTSNPHLMMTITSGSATITLVPGETKPLHITPSPMGKSYVSIDFRTAPSASTSFPWYGFTPKKGSVINSVTLNDCYSEKDKWIFSGSELKFQGYDESIPTQGVGQYTFYYKFPSVCINPRLTKPIIMLDGFDPENKTYEFTDDLFNKTSYDGGTKNLGDDLRNAGYDIGILNFPKYTVAETLKERDGGTDYIERNAMVLIKFINNVKDSLTKYGSTEDIILVGPSMGGQIARYALAYMEKQGWNHRVKLYISMDSPHEGSNIAISAQQTLYFLGNIYNNEAAKKNYNVKLYNPAAKQLLIHQMDGLDKTAPFHSKYYSDLKANGLTGSGGYPTLSRNVSLINGSSTGAKTGFGGVTTLELKATAAYVVKGMEFELKNTADFTTTRTLEIMARSNPKFGRNSTSTVELVPNMLLNYVSNYTILAQTQRATFDVTNIGVKGSMDITPGGTFNTYKEIADGVYESLRSKGIISSIDSTRHFDNHTFIPSVSALGFKNDNFYWSNRFDDRNLVCTNEIPFDNYYAPKQNEEHIYFTNESVAWLMEEINNGKKGCPTICATDVNRVGGDGYMCFTNSYTFALNETLSLTDYDIVWTLPAGIIDLTPSGKNSKNLQWDGINSPENRTLKIKITPKIGGVPCGASRTIEKELMYGEFHFDLDPTAATDPDFTVWVKPNSVMDYRYSWKESATSSWSALTTIPYKTFNKVSPSEYGKIYQVRIYPEGCGTYVQELSQGYLGTGATIDPGTGPTSDFVPFNNGDDNMLAPNPTTDYWTLLLNQDWYGQSITITIYNNLGQEVTSYATTSSYQMKINAKELTSGVYNIKISNNDNKVAYFKGVRL